MVLAKLLRLQIIYFFSGAAYNAESFLYTLNYSIDLAQSPPLAYKREKIRKNTN